MPATDAEEARFHFALPRLFTRLAGGDPKRVETNWLEANIVGAAVMLISYLALRRLLVGTDPSAVRELLLVVPLVLATWIFWLVALPFNALIIRLLRTAGVLTNVSTPDAQSVLVAVITTAFALQLTGAHAWPRLAGWLWIAAVCANLLAALLLAHISRTRDGK